MDALAAAYEDPANDLHALLEPIVDDSFQDVRTTAEGIRGSVNFALSAASNAIHTGANTNIYMWVYKDGRWQTETRNFER